MPQHPPLPLSLPPVFFFNCTLPTCLFLLMKHFPLCSIFVIFTHILDLLLLFTKEYLIISTLRPRWNKIHFGFLLHLYRVNWNNMALYRWYGCLFKPKCFCDDVRPLSASNLSLPLHLNATVAYIYFISLMWVTPVWRPSTRHSQIAVSETYLWHDLWASVTLSSQKGRHCPATALNSRRRGALSTLRQTRLPSLKRIKLFHHVGNEKAVITPN